MIFSYQSVLTLHHDQELQSTSDRAWEARAVGYELVSMIRGWCWRAALGELLTACCSGASRRLLALPQSGWPTILKMKASRLALQNLRIWSEEQHGLTGLLTQYQTVT